MTNKSTEDKVRGFTPELPDLPIDEVDIEETVFPDPITPPANQGKAQAAPGTALKANPVESKLLPALPEAAGICWVDVWETFADEETGQLRYCRWNVTHRSAESGIKAFGELHAGLHKFLETHPTLSLYPKHEVPAIQRGADAQAQAGGAFGAGKTAAGATPFGGKQQAAAGESAAATGGNGGSAEATSGTGVLNKIVVHPQDKGKTMIEFFVGNFKYPFKDARGPTTVAGLFDAELGITPEALSAPAVWTPESWAAAGFPTLVVDWEKPEKYYNVKKVRPGSA